MSLPTNFNQLGNAEASWMKWDLDKWKEEVQSRTENLPPFLRTPDAIKNATSVNSFFSDATASVTTPINYFRGSELPDWEYTSATNCDYFNYGNTSTVIGSLNAPNCESAQYAFNHCTKMTELKEKVLNINNLTHAFEYTKLSGDFVIYARYLDGAFQYITSGNKLNAEIFCPRNQNFRGVGTFQSSNNIDTVTVWADSMTISGMFNSSSVKSIFINSYTGMPITSAAFGHPFASLTKIKLIYGNARHSISSQTGLANNSVNLTQYIFSVSDFGVGNISIIFTGCKLDLPTVMLLSNEFVGFKNYSNRITIGVAKYKLAKDTSQEAREKYPLFFSYPVADTTSSLGYKEQDYTEEEIALYNVGKTKYEGDSILYVKQGGGETTNTAEAILNSYILTSTEGKTDISTVTDVSSFTDDDWENYYGYPPASGTMYYATGPLLKALRTISDRGWNITVQYN